MVPPVRYCIPGKCVVPVRSHRWGQRLESWMAISFWEPVADAVFFLAGERLCNLEEGSPGSGTYTRHGYIFSSLAGCLTKRSENGAVKEATSHLLFIFLLDRPSVLVLRHQHCRCIFRASP